MTRVAINGFGRIGRLILRSILEKKMEDIEVIAVNDLFPVKDLAYMFKYDSVHGRYPGEVSHTNDSLVIDGKKILATHEASLDLLKWDEMDIDVVIESTGIFRSRSLAYKHIQSGAKKVVITAPAPDPDVTIVLGVNEHQYDHEKHQIISNASCTTNCVAPILKIVNDEYSINKIFFSTIHSYTSDQRIVDTPHKSLTRGRAGAANIIPTSTGAANAIAEVIPSLKGLVNAVAFRVPVPNVSLVDLIIETKKEFNLEEVKQLLKNASENSHKGIIEYETEKLVSSDFIHNSSSVIIDANFFTAIDNSIRVNLWYDNEFGYATRIADLIRYMYS